MHIVRMKCFRTSFVIAALSSCLSLLVWAVQGYSSVFRQRLESAINSDGYSAFVWVLGTLLVFRTSSSLSRFWEGTTLVHQMMGHWTDMTHVTIGYTRYSSVEIDRVRLFKQTLVRLVSLLNAMILADLEGVDEDGDQCALHFQLLDIEAFEEDALTHIELSPRLGETPLLVFQWLNNLIVDEISSGVLNIPPPLLTRVFQAMNSAMLSYHDAKKYANIPFPFPYTAAIEMVMTIHGIFTPFVITSWTSSWLGAAMGTFVLVFLMWVLHLVPNELENPFEVSMNGLDTESMQVAMNERLRALIGDSMEYAPKLKKRITASVAHERLIRPISGCTARVAAPPKLKHMKSYRDVFVHKLRRGRSLWRSESCLTSEDTSSTRNTSFADSCASNAVLEDEVIHDEGGTPHHVASDPVNILSPSRSRHRRQVHRPLSERKSGINATVTFLDADGVALSAGVGKASWQEPLSVCLGDNRTHKVRFAMSSEDVQLCPESVDVLEGIPPEAKNTVIDGAPRVGMMPEPLPIAPRKTASFGPQEVVDQEAMVLPAVLIEGSYNPP